MSKTQEFLALLAGDLDPKLAAARAGLKWASARGIMSRASRSQRRASNRAAERMANPQPAEKPRDPKADRLAERVRHLEKALKDAEQAQLDQEYVREALFGLAAEPASPPAWLQQPRSSGWHNSTPVTIWSDWHLGEVVELDETNGANHFNLEIAAQRIEKLVNKTKSLCFDHMVNQRYPGIVVMLGGDIVTGEIHEELTRTNDADPLPTVLWARDHIVQGLLSLAETFGRVFVPCVAGNHGRMSRKVEHKHFAVRNYDWLISTLCEKYFTDTGDNRVKFFIPQSNEAAFKVYDHSFLLLHGHDLGCSGGDGIIGALGPIMRGKMKVGNQRRSVGQDFDTLVVGHWHQHIQLRGLVVNGTLKGFDGFANAGIRAAVEPATQALWFNHPKYGITARWPILLQDPEPVAAKEWISWLS